MSVEALVAVVTATAALMGAIGGFAVSIAQSRKVRVETRKLIEDTAVVREQVTNDHKSNLREDLSQALLMGARTQASVDELQATLAEFQAGVIAEMRVLRQEQAAERAARARLADAADAEHRRLWRAIRNRAWWRGKDHQ